MANWKQDLGDGRTVLWQDVGGGLFAPLGAAVPKSFPYTAVGGIYRVQARTQLLAAQAAGSRLFNFLNFGSNLLVILRYRIAWFQTVAHTAQIEDSLDTYMLTEGSVDNTNSQTPAAQEVRRGGFMNGAPGSANIAALAQAGNAAGITGASSLTKLGMVDSLPNLLMAAMPAQVIPSVLEHQPATHGGHPIILRQGEGFETENRVLLGAAAGSSVYFDLQWAELLAY